MEHLGNTYDETDERYHFDRMPGDAVNWLKTLYGDVDDDA